MGYQLKRDDIDGKYKNIFSKTQEDKDALFVYVSKEIGYKLTVKNYEEWDIDIFGENILGDGGISLDEFVKDSNIVNFNRVNIIGSNVFSNLSNTNEDIEFAFESAEVKIMPEAFGSNFEKLYGIKGLEGQLAVILYHNSFKNEYILENIRKFENTDVYLEGEWTKAEIKKLLEAEYDNGKIRNGSEFEIVGDLFTDEDLNDSNLKKLNKELADKISLNKESTKTKKEKISNEKNGTEGKSTWNKLDKELQEKIVNNMIKEFKGRVRVRIYLDENKAGLTETGKVIVTEGSVKNVIFLEEDNTAKIITTKEIFDKYGEEVKNNKANRDKAIDMARDKIKEYFNINTNNKEIVLNEYCSSKGPEGINCVFLLDIEAVKEKQKLKLEKKEIIEELTWNKVDKTTQEKIINEMIEEFNKSGVFVRIGLDENAVDLTDSGEIIIVKDSINEVSFIGKIVDATEKVFKRNHKDTEGKVIRLKNNKANKEEARNMAKKKIIDNFEENRTVLGEGDLKGLGEIVCKFVVDIEGLKKLDKFKDRKINLGDNIKQIKVNEVLDFSSVKEVFNKLETSLGNEKEVFLSKEECGRLLESIQLIAKKYKDRKDICKQCIKSIKILKKSKIKKDDIKFVSLTREKALLVIEIKKYVE